MTVPPKKAPFCAFYESRDDRSVAVMHSSPVRTAQENPLAQSARKVYCFAAVHWWCCTQGQVIWSIYK